MHWLFLSHHSAYNRIFMSNLKMVAMGKIFYFWNMQYNEEFFFFEIIVFVIVLYLSYKTVNKQVESINTIAYIFIVVFQRLVGNDCFCMIFTLWLKHFHFDTTFLCKKESYGVRYRNFTWVSHIKYAFQKIWYEKKNLA